MKTKISKITFIIAMLAAFMTSANMSAQTPQIGLVHYNGGYCSDSGSTIGENNSAYGLNSFVGGMNSTAGDATNPVNSQLSFAFGYNAHAAGKFSIAMGNSVTASKLNSIAIGSYVKANNQRSIAIGCGVSAENPLQINTKGIIMGVESYYPTFTITAGFDEVTGRIGIGNIAEPQAKLHIKADSYASGEDADILLEPTVTGKKAIIKFRNTDNQISVGVNNIMNFTASGFKFNTGKVGIGCDNTSDEFVLAVKGGILTDDVLVKAINYWPDFVFGKDYSLMSLSELKRFIDTNKHLPNVPSEAEVAENGVSVSEMQTVLLQKVEELTLYTIQQQEMIDQLREQCERQQQMIEKLMGK